MVATYTSLLVAAISLGWDSCSSGPDPQTEIVREQQINWRKDYLAARRESTYWQKPLLIYFRLPGHCSEWMGERIFSDPTVQSIVNNRFIPLRIDADNSPLAKALEIERYPTIIFATPDGKIIGRQEGYIVPAKFKAKLVDILLDGF